jgi:hypothetical protein
MPCCAAVTVRMQRQCIIHIGTALPETAAPAQYFEEKGGGTLIPYPKPPFSPSFHFSDALRAPTAPHRTAPPRLGSARLSPLRVAHIGYALSERLRAQVGL